MFRARQIYFYNRGENCDLIFKFISDKMWIFPFKRILYKISAEHIKNNQTKSILFSCVLKNDISFLLNLSCSSHVCIFLHQRTLFPLFPVDFTHQWNLLEVYIFNLIPKKPTVTEGNSDRNVGLLGTYLLVLYLNLLVIIYLSLSQSYSQKYIRLKYFHQWQI